MKSFILFSILSIISALAVCSAQNEQEPLKSQAPDNTTSTSTTTYTYETEFSKLDNATRIKWQELVSEATQLAQEQRVIEALYSLGQAEVIFAKHPQLLTIKSFSYIQQQRLDDALEYAQKAYDLNNNQYSAIHNLGEIYFDLNQWEKAKKYYTKLLDYADSPLLQFKLDIIEIKLGNLETVRPKLETLNPLAPEPYYLFLNYIVNCEDHPKNVEVKSALISQIKTIYQYSPNTLLPWFDKINHSGYGLQ